MNKVQIILSLFLALAVGLILTAYFLTNDTLLVVGITMAMLPLGLHIISSLFGTVAEIKIIRKNPTVYFDETNDCYHVSKECINYAQDNPAIDRLAAKKKRIPLCPLCGAKEIAGIYKDDNLEEVEIE